LSSFIVNPFPENQFDGIFFCFSTFGNQKYIVELKIWRGQAYHRDGINQLCDYLDRQNQTRGYLLVYDLRKETGKQGEWEKIKKQGKEIYAAWVWNLISKSSP
jgi:hypothetical protein